MQQNSKQKFLNPPSRGLEKYLKPFKHIFWMVLKSFLETDPDIWPEAANKKRHFVLFNLHFFNPKISIKSLLLCSWRFYFWHVWTPQRNQEKKRPINCDRQRQRGPGLQGENSFISLEKFHKKASLSVCWLSSDFLYLLTHSEQEALKSLKSLVSSWQHDDSSQG